MHRIISVFVLALTPLAAFGQSLDNLAWMTGHWSTLR